MSKGRTVLNELRLLPKVQNDFFLFEWKTLMVFLLLHFVFALNSRAEPESAKTVIHRIVRHAAAWEAAVAKIELRGQRPPE